MSLSGVRKLLDAIQRQGSSLTDRREHDLVVHREHMATEQAARRERVCDSLLLFKNSPSVITYFSQIDSSHTPVVS